MPERNLCSAQIQQPSGLALGVSPQKQIFQIKKYFELEPLARGKRWILQPSSLENMEAVRESFIQLIGQLEEKDLCSRRRWRTWRQ
ncbi:UNVERIFIED_CONTAM: hypothetical protein FKN15_070816 [Acipenser sinensis]